MLSVTNSPRPATYMPQLDGLRAVAVVCVMVFHFIPWVDRYAPLGTMGVRLFFVLSGFLITGILLAWRGQPLDVALKSFYARRALRIFPLFYFVLVAAAALNIGPAVDDVGGQNQLRALRLPRLHAVLAWPLRAGVRDHGGTGSCRDADQRDRTHRAGIVALARTPVPETETAPSLRHR